MYIKIFRGIVISFLSAIIITFVLMIFGPFLPINIFQGNLGIISFILIIVVSYFVYVILPQEAHLIDSSVLKNDNIQEIKKV